ncbi:hypothetical protein BDR06DRAFT_970294 [Suillus hirtellus]|nr:hypothetical protein BDR06DRAFT_970294 [Suillus hirtellus]
MSLMPADWALATTHIASDYVYRQFCAIVGVMPKVLPPPELDVVLMLGCSHLARILAKLASSAALTTSSPQQEAPDSFSASFCNTSELIVSLSILVSYGGKGLEKGINRVLTHFSLSILSRRLNATVCITGLAASGSSHQLGLWCGNFDYVGITIECFFFLFAPNNGAGFDMGWTRLSSLSLGAAIGLCLAFLEVFPGLLRGSWVDVTINFDMTRYSKVLQKQERGVNPRREEFLLTRYQPDHEIILEHPAVVLDKFDLIMLWYLPGAIDAAIQNDMLLATMMMSGLLGKSITCGTSLKDTWCTHKSNFQISDHGLTSGCINLLLGWFLQGYPAPQFQLEVSVTLESDNGVAYCWAMYRLAALVAAALRMPNIGIEIAYNAGVMAGASERIVRHGVNWVNSD